MYDPAEEEFYDQCSEFLNHKEVEHGNPIRDGERRTYLLAALTETDDDIGMTLLIIDPSMNSSIPREVFFKSPMRHQVMLKARTEIEKIIRKLTKDIASIHGLAETLNLPLTTIVKMIEESDGPEEFRRKCEEIR